MKVPVNDFSWEQLMDFLATLNERTGKTFRLPTEAEWEYAAQGGKETKGFLYSGSNDVYEVAWLKKMETISNMRSAFYNRMNLDCMI